MGIIRQLIKPSLSSGFKPALRTSINTISRYFTEFDEVAQSYIALDNQIRYEVGDIVTLDFEATPAQLDFATLFDGSSVDRVAIRKESNNFAFFGITSATLDGVPISSGDPFPTDGNFHRLSCVVSLAGVLRYIGSNFVQTSTAFYSGIIASFSVKRGASLVLDMPIDQNYTPTNNTVIDRSPSGNNGTIVNVATGDSERFSFMGEEWAGIELLTNGTFNTDLQGWIFGSNQDAVTAQWESGAVLLARGSGGSSGGLTQSVTTSIGGKYRLSFDKKSAQGVALRVDPSQLQTQISSGKGSAEFSWVAQGASASPYFWNINNNSTTILDTISVKRILEIA